MHSFFDYHAKKVWHFIELLLFSNNIEFSTLLWCSRWRRNEKVWENNENLSLISFNLAKERISQWRAIRSTHSLNVFYSHCNHSQWSKLGVGYIKCNMDISVFNEDSNFNPGTFLHGNGVGLF